MHHAQDKVSTPGAHAACAGCMLGTTQLWYWESVQATERLPALKQVARAA